MIIVDCSKLAKNCSFVEIPLNVNADPFLPRFFVDFNDSVSNVIYKDLNSDCYRENE
jgi:hypothetical protein